MRLTVVFTRYLLIFGCCCLVVRVHTICGKDEYPVTGSDTRKCFHCTHCHPGYGLDPKCGTTIKWLIDKIDCKVCEPGTYNDKDDSSPCLACHNCAKHEIVTTQCTNKSDTICSGTCKKGYFFAKKDSTHSCQKCSYCCFDGNDEIVSECANQGLNATKQHCSPRPDKDCSPVSSRSTPSINQISRTTEASKSGGGLSQTTIVVLGVLGAVVVIALVAIPCLYRLYRRKKKKEVAHTQQPRVAEEGNGSANNYSSHDYASNGPQAETADRVKFILPDETLDPKTNPDFVGTPRGSQDGLDKSVDSGAAANQAGEKIVKLPDDKKSKGKPLLKRQSSQDSHNSGDGEVGFRRRSSSTISFEKLKRKLSEKDESLIEKDSDQIHELPIKIEKQPKSQRQKEGSRVEFKFKVQGHDMLLYMYQWFKDGVEVLGQNNATLVLECVELRDFGCYTCQVSYQDGYGEIKSSNAVLDVIPQCLNGKRPKRLQEVGLNTRDEIACLLENKQYSLGGCRQVAARYGMKEHEIGALVNSREPGKDVMEFLKGSKPDLTVYSFCKVLKEYKIERFDIVKLLENHLLIKEGVAATYL